MEPLLKGLRVLVTAGASGIGQAISDTFASAGARIYICDVDERALETFVHERPNAGAKVADVSSPEAVDALFDAAARTFTKPNWEEQVFASTRLEKIFLTNAFDDPLTGFDTARYVPCLRTDDLVFHLDKPAVRGSLKSGPG